MSWQLSERIAQVEPSATLAMTARAKSMRAEGVDVLAMSAGEPDFDTPDNIKAAAKAAIDAGKTKYTPVPGAPDLRAAVCTRVKQVYGCDVEPNQVIVGAGGKQVLFNACSALLNPGDEAVFCAPYWVSYPDMVRFTGATPVVVPTDDTQNFLPTVAGLEAAFTGKTRLLFLNSPSNPTGAAYDRAQLEAIADLLRKYPDIFVITDDIYSDLVYDGEFVSFAHVAPDLAHRTLIASGVSKTYAMTGWRIGYGVGPVEVVSAMSRLQGASTSGASSIAQAAAVEALVGDQSAVATMLEAFRGRRDRIVAGLRGIDGMRVFEPKGAFYVFPRVDAFFKGAVDSSMKLCEHLLDKAHVAIVPGSAFGAENYARISFACSEEQIDAAVARIREGLAQL